MSSLQKRKNALDHKIKYEKILGIKYENINLTHAEYNSYITLTHAEYNRYVTSSKKVFPEKELFAILY